MAAGRRDRAGGWLGVWWLFSTGMFSSGNIMWNDEQIIFVMQLTLEALEHSMAYDFVVVQVIFLLALLHMLH